MTTQESSAPPRRWVALYGGSFNPPHLGHVMATAYVLSAHAPDQVWWIPVGSHAFDKGRGMASFSDRFAMCERASEPFGARVRVLDIEGRREGTSRTIDTVRQLRAEHPDVDFRLIMGTDLWPDTPRWKQFEELTALAPPLWIGREGYPAPPGVEIAFCIPNVSSTQARRALAGTDPSAARSALPLAVWEFAASAGVYKEPARTPATAATAAANRVFLVGAGRAGLAIGLLLQRAGVNVVGACTATDASARVAQSLLGVPTSTAEAIPPAASFDVAWFLTPDRRIATAAAALHTRGLIGAQTVLLHSSGSLPARILRDAAPLAAGVASVHPLYPFGDALRDSEAIRHSTWTVEGDAAGIGCARALLEPAGISPRAIDAEHRAAYHAAAVVASNAAVALLAWSRDILVSIGWPPDEALDAVIPLMQHAVEQVVVRGPEAALTGPVVRGDVDVLAAHVRALREVAPTHMGRHWVEWYETLCQMLIQVAEASGRLTEPELDALRRRLSRL